MKKNKLLLVLFSISLLFVVACATVSPVHISSEKGDLKTLKEILSTEKTEANATTSQGWTPLMFAAKAGNTEIAEYLIKMEAVVNTNSNELTNDTIRKHAHREGFTPLYIASLYNHIEIVRLLLNNDADINTKTFKGYTPLYTACKEKHFQVAKLLIEKGAGINIQDYNGFTPLMALLSNTSENEILDFVTYLIANGADVNAMSSKTWIPTESTSKNESTLHTLNSEFAGWTPLMVAVAMGHVNIVKLLLDKRADITPKPHDQFCSYYYTGWTPLMMSAANGHLEIAKLLLGKGAGINNKTKDLRTSLHIAARMDQKEIAEYLIKNGAEVQIFDNDGEDSYATALSYQLSAKNIESKGDKQKVIEDYKSAVRYYEKASSQFNEESNKLSKKITRVRVGNVLGAALAGVSAQYQANAQAKQMAQISALQGGSGTGYGYASVPHHVTGTTSLEQLKEEYSKLFEKCRQSAVDVKKILNGFR